ncbi:MAG: cytochrome c3 family protein [Magnetococcales bacterium]|nr:cytochrome c3 family protein [Magnetococcales bacterium]
MILLYSPSWLLAEVLQSGPVNKGECTGCHAWRNPETTRRTLSPPHERLRLQHGQERLWCLDCHRAEQPGELRTRSGEKWPFAESWRLCADCHGPRTREWQYGIHGKRVGSWQGERTMQRCTVCHDPHTPAWKITPMTPPPQRPNRNVP